MKKVLIFLLGFLLALGVLSAFPMRDDDEPAKTDKKEDVTTTDDTGDDSADSTTSSLADEITASLSYSRRVLSIDYDARANEIESIECEVEGIDTPFALNFDQRTIDLIECFGTECGTHLATLNIVLRDGSIVTVDKEFVYEVKQTLICHYDLPDENEKATVYYVEGMTWEEAFSLNLNTFEPSYTDSSGTICFFSNEVVIYKEYMNGDSEKLNNVITQECYVYG